jgi:hypothetical protein
MRSNKNPFTNWLKGFQHPAAPPRKQAPHKFYMHQEEFAKKVDARFRENWDRAGLEKKFELDFRCKCAKELLEEEDEEVRDALITKLEAAHELAMEDYTKRAELLADPDANSAEAQIE